jgi:hypothetical protein
VQRRLERGASSAGACLTMVARAAVEGSCLMPLAFRHLGTCTIDSAGVF